MKNLIFKKNTKNYSSVFLKKNIILKKKKNFFFFYNPTINNLNLYYFFAKQQYLQNFFKKSDTTLLLFNICKKQLFINLYSFFKKKNLVTLSVGVFLSYLNIKIKFIKNNVKGWFLLINFINKKFLNVYNKSTTFFFIIKGLKKKINLILQKITQLFSFNFTSSYFFMLPKVKKYEKIKKYIKRRIKKKIIKIENIL